MNSLPERFQQHRHPVHYGGEVERGAAHPIASVSVDVSSAGLMLDPDQRIQEVIRLIFARFQDIGSAR